MIRFIPPNDFLSLCYGLSDWLTFISSLVGEALKVIGIDIPSLRPVCFQIFQFLSA